MSWLFEDSLKLLFFLGILEVGLVFAFFKSGQLKMLIPVVLVALLAGVALWVEKYVVTEAEKVEIVLYQAAEALETNNIEQVLNFIADDEEKALMMRIHVSAVLSQVQITDAHINGLQVNVNELTSPPTAVATFTGAISAKGTGDLTLPHETYRYRFEVTLKRVGEDWKMLEYKILDPMRGPTQVP